jgi:hypothetical protein
MALHPPAVRERRAVRRATLLLCLLVVDAAALWASHTPLLTRAEEACQRAAGPATDRVGAARARCVLRCERKALRGRVDPSACLPPYDARVGTCIDAAGKRARASIARACRADCPECYLGGDCTAFGSGAVDVTGQVVDDLVKRVLCTDAAPVPSAAERCRLVVGHVLAEAAVRMGRCFVRCRRDEEHGRLPPAACTSVPLPVRTRACLAGITNGANATITRKCPALPPCLTPASALMSALLTQISTDYESFLFCPSPSGAFVDAD